MMNMQTQTDTDSHIGENENKKDFGEFKTVVLIPTAWNGWEDGVTTTFANI